MYVSLSRLTCSAVFSVRLESLTYWNCQAGKPNVRLALRLNPESEVRHFTFGQRLLKMFQHGTLAKIQFLQRDGVRCVEVEDAGTKVAYLERRFQMGIEYRRDRLMDRVTCQYLGVTAPRQQLIDERPNRANARLVLRSPRFAFRRSVWVIGSA